MDARRVGVVLVVVLAIVPSMVYASFPCCANQVSKEPYAACTCLEDDTWMRGETLPLGQSRHYHWRLTNWAMINVPDDQRPDLTFMVATCQGNAHLYVTPMQPPFPDSGTARWKSTNDGALNSITTKLQYSEYLITVEAVHGAPLANYSIVAIVDASKPVVAGASGVVEALPIQDDETILYSDDTMSMIVRFTTSSQDAMYRVYVAEAGPGSEACQQDASVVGDCVLTTVCGMEVGGMTARTGWQSYPANQAVNVIIDELKQDQPYVFNVAAKNGEWETAYVATQGTPTYRRETKAQDDNTVMIVIIVAACVFLLLVALILWARVRLQKAYHRQHYSRNANRFHGL